MPKRVYVIDVAELSTAIRGWHGVPPRVEGEIRIMGQLYGGSSNRPEDTQDTEQLDRLRQRLEDAIRACFSNVGGEG